MQKIYAILFVFVSVLNLQAQEKLVTGSVTDISGALPGVSVLIQGSDEGTMTDLDGNYSIKVNNGQVLVFSFIGYTTKNITYKGQEVLNVKLADEASELGEVIINVPYGTANKKTYTGSVGLIQAKSIEKSQVSNVTKILEGSVAGVQSFSASGQPGSEATIRIRGVGSVNASSKPLYVVDGVPYEGELSAIAASDIESMTVLKDATAATLYGSRAANGVVMITTKQGTRDTAPQIEITAKHGISSRSRSDYKQLSTNQYMELQWEAIRNGRMDNAKMNAADAAEYATKNLIGSIGINPYGLDNPMPVGVDGKLLPGLNPLWNDNWEDALSQNARYTDVNLKVSGGGANSRYFISGGFLNDQGYVLESGFKRYNLRSNIVVDAKSWLELGLNVSAASSEQNYPKQDDSAISNVIGFARGLPSFYPIYQRDLTTGAYLLDEDTGNRLYDYGAYRKSSYARYNLVATLPEDLSSIKKDVATVRTYAQVKLLDNLKFKSSLNVDYNSTNNHNVINPDFGPSAESGGSISRKNTRTVSMTFNNILNYNVDLDDKNNISAMVGQEYYQFDSNAFGGARQQIIMNGYLEPSAASKLLDFYGDADQYKMLSFFGNAQYSYDRKYYLSASYRADASSRFHPSTRWGGFWSFGASWKVIDEDFMSAYRDTWLSNLLFRASYGAQGNDNIGYYAYQALFNIYNNLGESGLYASRIGTPDLSWESNLNLNIGVDFGLFNDRLTGTVEYFERRSKDLLFNRQLASSIGFSSVQENIGAMKNYGWEFTLDGYPIVTDDWKLHLGMNLTTYKNKITALPSKEMWSGNKKWVEGGSLYDFYLAEWAGVNPENGNAQWYLQNEDGSKTVTEDYSQITKKDRIHKGNSLPDVTGGFLTEVTYKNWQLAANFVYTVGGKIYNSDKTSLYRQAGNGNTWSADMMDRWTPENTDTDVARLSTNPRSSWTNQSDRFLVDRSFLKLKNLTVSYNLPKEWLRKINLGSASIFFQAENLFTWTKEQGLDPEQTFDGNTYYRYPAMKTLSLGVNIKL
ncbi:SusC/RagA family TonB-linked outer membrane protein [Myroides profundi]|uniref:TonB-linked outer membrane protein, SusC/RagA family n=1 Tax=Myroides profundi TaxID=480520 RepID=A0AAJ4W2K7_MYRPR|nr:TonB-dependent receptor [Myroides profundi]AJH16450.1 membrane protein [Myroides profundi]SEQ54559.1 TonB-linked outer membrane protein, SusC/RagA family [Myroides profundi]